MSDNILFLNNICKKYESFQLLNVSFKIKRGTVVGFVGKNGAGKTTTLKAIMNLIHIDSGSVSLFESNKNIDDIKQKVGFALNSMDYYPNFTLKRIANVLKLFYKEFNDEIFYSLMKKFNLNDKKKVNELSSGMKTKFNLAIAIAHNAELLILDEPTSGLDPFSRHEICELFKEFVSKGNRSILFSTHIISDLENSANEIIFIDNGKIIFHKSIEHLFQDYRSKYNISFDKALTLEEVVLKYEESDFDKKTFI